ncbi:MAG: hypothetical protein A2073_01055 [Deltaproteobacteria bacterium GWC2_42_11]|nr:MAG: hypothetical protein A2073_01055 [Deltaproteobacteria bacterium GWC2_42_11]
MYKNIFLPLDNSKYSNYCIDLAISLTKDFGSHITGSHVYAARLHDNRFRQMESGLPPKYQDEKELQKQRDVHDDLITKGLQIISDSYLDVFENRCKEANVSCSRKMLEGKNYLEIVKDVQTSDYDLVIIGFLGLGEVKKTQIGSVCERVARRIKTDCLIVKNNHIPKKIVACIDGSPNSFGGLKSAIAMARFFSSEVTCVAAFDPNFHYSAFKNIAGVLSDEAGKIFKFKEQERLHEEIIDKGLAKIYQDHLDTAKAIAKDDGFEIKTELLTGKAFEEILKYVERETPDLLVMGRVGVHAAPELDIGSNTENCFRLAKCNVLISGREFVPPLPLRERDGVRGQSNIAWTKEALDLLEKIPPFAKGIVIQIVNDYAVKKGYKEIDVKVMQEARGQMMGKDK